MSKPYRMPNSRFWWIRPWIDGRQVRQSSGEINYSKAEKKLKILEGKIADNAPIRPKTDRETFGALLDLVILNYKRKDRRSIYDLKNRIEKHLRPHFGDMVSGKVTSDAVDLYIDERMSLKKPPANATVNRELAIIRRAFELGRRAQMVSFKPFIEALDEDNVREGYFEEAQFRAVLRHGHTLMGAILTVSYLTGWRIASVLSLEWKNVDWQAGFLRLYAKVTKTRKDAVIPLAMFPELKERLAERWKDTEEVQRKNGQIVTAVFHRDGMPVRSIRGEFEAARVKAGCPGRLIHDMKRTAVRNLSDAGFSETEVMLMVGIKTVEIFRRYNIRTEKDIREKADRLVKAREASGRE